MTYEKTGISIILKIRLILIKSCVVILILLFDTLIFIKKLFYLSLNLSLHLHLTFISDGSCKNHLNLL